MHHDLLSGIQVLVTRPEHQAQALCDRLLAQGDRAIRLPVIEIQPKPLSKAMINTIKPLNKIDFAIFISPNAVQYGLTQLLEYGTIPDKLKLVTIGQASALKLQEILGRSADIYPRQQYNSEALLALDELSAEQVNNKHIIIFRGCGGRELLAKTLKQRGAGVFYAEVYQRVKPLPEPAHLKRIWDTASEQPDIITITSNEGLNNLYSILEKNTLYLDYLLQTPLVVVTEKMRHNAQAMGFKNTILVASNAGNEALLESILKWARISREISAPSGLSINSVDS